MTEKLLIEKSEELLLAFFKELGEKERNDIGLMGGWAVHFLLKTHGVNHMGSRDIDIFFDPNKTSISIITKKLGQLGFWPHSTFRWVKIFHSETEKELSDEESKKHPIHNLSYVYFDIATPTPQQHAMPEPLLKKVFEKEKRFIEIHGTRVMIPTPKILVEMKLKSSVERTDLFKRAKDVADLYGLLNSNPEFWVYQKGQKAKTRGLNPKLVKKFKEKVRRFKIDGTTQLAAELIKTNENKITELIEKT
ncbi:MAG: hypothetical protein Q7K34_04880 [archaeon]|nr:hypothetical protein [archaeon]